MVQLPVNVPGRAAKDGQSTWVPTTHEGNASRVHASWIGSVLTRIVNQWIGDLSLCLSLFMSLLSSLHVSLLSCLQMCLQWLMSL